jgi:hypothetical protein
MQPTIKTKSLETPVLLSLFKVSSGSVSGNHTDTTIASQMDRQEMLNHHGLKNGLDS